MNSSTDQLRATLRRLQMRWWQVRAIEIAALSIAIGSVIGLLAVPLFAWQGEANWPVPVGLILLALVCSGFIALRNKPTQLQTAMEVDRQWRLHDLLASAIGLLSTPNREGVDASMQATVLQLAAFELERREPANLSFSRMRPRIWAGLSSLPVLLILITAICSHPLVLKAAADAKSAVASSAGVASQAVIGANRRPSQDARTRSSSDDESTPSDARNFPEVKSAPNSSPSNSKLADSAGSASGRTNDAQFAPRMQGDTFHGATSKDGNATGGSGDIVPRQYGDWRSGTVTSSPRPIAPWEQSTWEDRRTKALDSLNQNPPAAGYRDLIRDYFSR